MMSTMSHAAVSATTNVRVDVRGASRPASRVHNNSQARVHHRHHRRHGVGTTLSSSGRTTTTTTTCKASPTSETTTSSSSSSSSTTDKEKPDWAGDDFLSRVVDAAISNKVLYEGIMKPMARRTLINTAEKNGVAWRDIAAALEADPSLEKKFASIENKDVTYPEYYLKPFHAYSEGNLCWLAAFEAEPATYSMALRVYPKDRITADAAQGRLRDSYTAALRSHVEEHSGGVEPEVIVDVGCSVGISTRYISDAFPSAQMIGLDLSPYMLAVAAHRDENQPGRERRTWVHGKGEDTGMADGSADVVSLAFVIHECPEDATRALMKEAARILKPGGTFVMTDNNPKSSVIQNLPPALFTLMKSTEPHSNEYYTVDIEGMLRECGFEHVHTEDTDPRHRTVLGTKKG